mgnify:FL=1
MKITAKQWQHFDREGFLHLGQVASDQQLVDMQQRINDIMLGLAPINYDQLLMQLDREPRTGKPGPQTTGHKGATLLYRKIQQLEFDPLFFTYIAHSLFESICQRTYGRQTSVSCYRAMFMNKPAGEGTYLSWHQDRWIDLDQDPQITIYTALDPATQENGCVQLIPGSHRNPFNSSSGAGLLSREQVDSILQQTDPLPLELALGEVVLLHNWTLHSSGTNQTQTSRRAFSVCYMHGETKIRSAKGVDYISVKDGSFPRVFGPGALTVECLGDYRTPIIEV